jgi:prophage antirepressor-like protein
MTCVVILGNSCSNPHPGLRPGLFKPTILNAVAIPWWMVKEIYDILAPNNATVAVNRMNGSEKSWVGRTDLGLNPGSPIVVINEPGLYRSIFQSRKPVARAFKRWVTHEVLPAIRRTVGYRTDPTKDNHPTTRLPAN